MTAATLNPGVREQHRLAEENVLVFIVQTAPRWQQSVCLFCVSLPPLLLSLCSHAQAVQYCGE